ncbi:glycoside hydrolase family 16 protein [Algimonas porphyrae]|uniref:Beta-glucanase n=1 Tax=Algimonas porphyrae TaxID=1128113 RepID=A0ABQ5V1H3_9PROT|nr:glycoside hydrolase family 16 protein [Algimonas porphyrae]GLQ21405.1 beta-glucanase [Algimonas porphyrae]
MKISPRLVIFFAACLLAACANAPRPDAPSVATDVSTTLTERGWEMVWNDEFDGNTLDRSKWAPEVSCWGGGNQERQCYLDRDENVIVENGYLHLRAFADDVSGPSVHMEHPDYPGETVSRNYASGKVRTRDLAYWTFGRIEGRMKLPGGQGAWPAFWMMPQFDVHGGWPLSGEIDIMEAVNLGAACFDCDAGTVENRSSGALHFGKKPPENEYVTKRRPLTAQPGQDGLPRDQFHSYAVEWGEGRIDWFVDGERFYSVSSDDWYTDAVDKSDDPNAPFNEDFYVMLNFAVGGAWPERDNETGLDPEILPSEFVIDYVRVYQCAQDPETGRACMMDD